MSQLASRTHFFRSVGMFSHALEERGFVHLGQPVMATLDRWVRLTAAGQEFVQPELTSLGNADLVADLLAATERSVVLTYGEEKSSGFLFELRDAFVRNRADLIVKLMIEVLPQIAAAASGK